MKADQGADTGRFGEPARRRLWWWWVVANGIGEAVGLGGAAVAGALVLGAARDRFGFLEAAVLSAAVFGIVEGTIVGFAQATVLRWPLPFLRRRGWVGATIVGGILAWLAVSVPLTEGSSGLTGQLLVAAGLGLVTGPVLGVPQWLVLRAHVPRAESWIWANVAAWALGLPAVVLGVGAAPADAAWYVVGAFAVPALLAAGAIVGAIHGLILVRLVGYRLEPNRYAHHVVEELEHVQLRYGLDDQ